MKAETRKLKRVQGRPGWGHEQAVSGDIAVALRELRQVVDELRAQLAGTAKSHFTVEEIARMTGRAAYTVRTWIKQGALRAERVAGTGPRGRLLIPRDEMRRLIAVGKGTDVPASVVRNRK